MIKLIALIRILMKHLYVLVLDNFRLSNVQEYPVFLEEPQGLEKSMSKSQHILKRGTFKTISIVIVNK